MKTINYKKDNVTNTIIFIFIYNLNEQVLEKIEKKTDPTVNNKITVINTIDTLSSYDRWPVMTIRYSVPECFIFLKFCLGFLVTGKPIFVYIALQLKYVSICDASFPFPVANKNC